MGSAATNWSQHQHVKVKRSGNREKKKKKKVWTLDLRVWSTNPSGGSALGPSWKYVIFTWSVKSAVRKRLGWTAWGPGTMKLAKDKTARFLGIVIMVADQFRSDGSGWSVVEIFFLSKVCCCRRLDGNTYYENCANSKKERKKIQAFLSGNCKFFSKKFLIAVERIVAMLIVLKFDGELLMGYGSTQKAKTWVCLK